MEVSIRSCCAIFLSLVVITSHAQSAPAAASPQALQNIILELENVLYKLKDYAREVQAAQSQKKVGAKYQEAFETQYNPSEGRASVDKDLTDLENAASQQQRQPAPQRPKPSPQQQPVSEDASDISLKEALEYLVGLAKEKKVERRDHDIPFPLNDRDRQ